ncbi:MAG: CCA tRNA nucleotidyltransferase, partial [Bdellovibrionales bacterium]|nr:CCA tRNA nucleotidyltransferase [Bdellovibrionales bacterium]
MNPGTTSYPDGNSTYLEELAKTASSKPVTIIQKALGEASDLHLVGGTVRNAIAGIENSDLDLSSNLAPESALQKLNSANVKVIETGLKHGTLTVVIDKQQIELTTFRKPGPHGLSNFSNSIEVDLSGRDFTINAIAYSVKDKILLDPMDGIKDLNQKILKAVNDPLERFKEDPLRILRML